MVFKHRYVSSSHSQCIICRTRRYPSNLIAGSVNGGGIFSKGAVLTTYFDTNATARVQQLLVSEVPVLSAADVEDDESTAVMLSPTPPAEFPEIYPHIDRTCIVADWLPPQACILFGSSPASMFWMNRKLSDVECAFNATIGADTSDGSWYAFTAVDEVLAAHGTPDALRLQACVVVNCVSYGDLPKAGNVTCSSAFTSTTSFAAFSMETKSDKTTEFLPFLALSGVSCFVQH